LGKSAAARASIEIATPKGRWKKDEMTRSDNNDVTVTHQRSGNNRIVVGEGDTERVGGTVELGRQANKGILADTVAEELNVPRRTAARVLDAVLDSVRSLLAARGKVAVKGFGTFERRVRKGRAYKHPLSGKSIDVADKETIMFKPSDALIADTRSGSTRTRKASKGNTPDEIIFKS
jgi:nucleoid DNA-binding protein